MSITLLATQVPAPQTFSGFLRLADGNNTTGAGIPVGSPIVGGVDTVVSNKHNRNLQMVDLIGRYGGGLMAIAYGLGLSAGAGLTLNVAAGQIICDGVVELAAATTATMFDNTRNFIWFKRDGTLEVRNNVLTAPAIPGVFIGSVLTSGGAITQIDTSGVCYIHTNILYRQTADTGMPGDTPPSTVFIETVTSGGRWFWDGTAYLRMVDALAMNQDYILAGQAPYIPSNYQVSIFGDLDIDGDISIDGELRVTD